MTIKLLAMAALISASVAAPVFAGDPAYFEEFENL